jgi:hypothetical protein
VSFAKLAEAFADDSIRVLAAALDREHAVELAGDPVSYTHLTLPTNVP